MSQVQWLFLCQKRVLDHLMMKHGAPHQSVHRHILACIESEYTESMFLKNMMQLTRRLQSALHHLILPPLRIMWSLTVDYLPHASGWLPSLVQDTYSNEHQTYCTSTYHVSSSDSKLSLSLTGLPGKRAPVTRVSFIMMWNPTIQQLLVHVCERQYW